VLIGPDGRPRLTDFGIAQSEDSTDLTDTGQVIGTLKYLAPEVARGHPATPQSDLYSLGVLLAEISGAHAPPDLARLIECLTAPDPTRRPRSAAEALSALNAGGDRTAPTSVLPRRGPARRRLYAPARRRRGLMVAAGAMAVAVVVVIVVIASAGGRSKQPERVATPNAPLGRQLDALDRIIDDAAQH